jgi:two-component system NtrC family sensor kinase
MSADRERPQAAPQSQRIDLSRIQAILPQLIDSLSDAVLVVDRDHRVVAANRRYVECFGTDEFEAGSVCTRASCPETRSGAEPGHCATCDVLTIRRTERRLRVLPDDTGAQRRWEGTFSPVFDARGEVSHVVELWRDVSERGQLETQLSHSERLAALGVLAAGVAHEINNPLAAILIGVESLQRRCARGDREIVAPPADTAGEAGKRGGGEEAREIRGLLDTLEAETRRCQEITEKLMMLAQPYSGISDWMDLNRASQDTLHLLRYQMQRQGVIAVEDLADDVPKIWARESGIRGICMNLMMNAVQAMAQGGTLTIRTRRVGSREVRIEISDTGPGISPKHFDRIWDPFFTTKPTGQGTGLGLSITQRIVTRHHGTVRAENLPGGGARFTVDLPITGSGGSAGG